MSAAAEKVKHYGFALATVYMCYFTYGIQALILSQNKVNFYTQWGITDPTAGSAAVSMAAVSSTTGFTTAGVFDNVTALEPAASSPTA